jgi:hypothetical protein
MSIWSKNASYWTCRCAQLGTRQRRLRASSFVVLCVRERRWRQGQAELEALLEPEALAELEQPMKARAAPEASEPAEPWAALEALKPAAEPEEAGGAQLQARGCNAVTG